MVGMIEIIEHLPSADTILFIALLLGIMLILSSIVVSISLLKVVFLDLTSFGGAG